MADDDELGFRVIPGYELLRPIGRGGMGVAYLARQLSLGRRVVIKFLGRDPEIDPIEQAARFRREAQLMAKISHPNVATIFDFGIVDDRPFLVMEYIEGGDLRAQMVSGSPLPVERVRHLLRCLVRALECLHERGILHRDLKPENILMAREDTPKVSDFGIAVPGSDVGSLTQSGRIVGTAGYLSPEQQYRLQVDERSDQYSLAALAYELLTGQLPLGAFLLPSRLNPRLHAAVDPVIQRALSEDRNARYASIREFGDGLDRALAIPRRRRERLWVASSVAILSACVVLAVRHGVGRPSITPMHAASVRTSTPATSPRSEPPGSLPSRPARVTIPGRDDERPTVTREDAHTLKGRPSDQPREHPPTAGDLATASKSSHREKVIVNSLGMSLVLIPKGEFLMGAPDSDPAANTDEKPQHPVRIDRSFYLGACEVTVSQFRAFVNDTGYQTKAEADGKGGAVYDRNRGKIVKVPELNWRNPGLSRPQSDEEPVVQVCWTDAHAFCGWLSRKEGMFYRLPDEAEWEYACRAGGQERWCFGDDPAALGDFAWFAKNADHVTHPVGRKRPNAFGLFDMHGNVWEWCQDYYVPTYASGAGADPEGAPESRDHVLRGGSWSNVKPEDLRSANRRHFGSGSRYYTFGFRVRRSVNPPTATPGSP